MSYYLFDNVNNLYLLAAAVELVAVSYFFLSQRQLRALVLLAGPILAMAAWTLDYAVQTDREKIVATVEKIIDASVTPDTGAMLGTLHNDINISGKKLNQIAVIILSYFKQKPLSANHLKSIKVLSTEPTNASAEFTALTIFDPDGEYAAIGMVTSKWLFNFQKDDKARYKITNMTMISVGNSKPIDLFNK